MTALDRERQGALTLCGAGMGSSGSLLALLLLRRSRVRLAAIAGLSFVSAMFLLTFAGLLTRTGKIQGSG